VGHAAEASVDVVTLASLLGHSKLMMVTCYVHPGENHRIESVKQLAIRNAAREIEEAEKSKARESVPTEFPTVAENSANFSEEKTEDKSNHIN
jgi:hypothetical protein